MLLNIQQINGSPILCFQLHTYGLPFISLKGGLYGGFYFCI